MTGTMRWRGLGPLWPLALVLVMTVVGCAMANQNVQLPDGDGPWQRFIVKFEADSAPGRDSAQVQSRLDAAAKTLAPSGDLALRWERRMGIGADVVTASVPLDRVRTQRLLAGFAADPEIEYAEIDGVMTIGPVPGSRAR